MHGLTIMCMKAQYITVLDVLNFLAMPLQKLPKEFVIACSESWYSHFFDTNDNLNYVGIYPEVP
jgi:hypothetical protein